MKYIPLIISLLLILAVIISIWCLIRYFRRKARQFSHSVAGQLLRSVTNENTNLDAIRKEELASRPKSLSAVTRLMLPRITADFPAFSFDEMKHRAEQVLTSYLHAVSKKDTSLLSEGSQELYAKLQNHIASLNSDNRKETFEQIKIHRTEISNYTKTAGRCIVTFQSAVECKHYIEKDGQLTDGSKDYKYQTRFEVELVYIQDREIVAEESEKALAMNCPNCGAPLASLGAKVCEYCGSPLVEINIHAWTFFDVTEN